MKGSGVDATILPVYIIYMFIIIMFTVISILPVFNINIVFLNSLILSIQIEIYLFFLIMLLYIDISKHSINLTFLL